MVSCIGAVTQKPGVAFCKLKGGVESAEENRSNDMVKQTCEKRSIRDTPLSVACPFHKKYRTMSSHLQFMATSSKHSTSITRRLSGKVLGVYFGDTPFVNPA